MKFCNMLKTNKMKNLYKKDKKEKLLKSSNTVDKIVKNIL